MNAELDALIRLQQVRDKIAALTARIDQEIPSKIADLETALREVRERVEAGRLQIEEARKERSRLDLDLRDAEDKINKYKTALMQVKNNDEYRAALNEIDYTQRTYGEVEARLLELMEEVEAKAGEMTTLEEEMRVEDEKIHADRKVLEDAGNKLAAERELLEREAGGIEAGLPRPLLATYCRISSVRAGVAMARAADGICVACNMRMRPAVFQLVKRNEQVIACDSCKRILYYDEQAEDAATDAAPPADGDGTPAAGNGTPVADAASAPAETTPAPAAAAAPTGTPPAGPASRQGE